MAVSILLNFVISLVSQFFIRGIYNKWSLFSGQNIGAVGGGGGFGGSSYESSSFESSSSGAGFGGGVAGLASGASGYESASFSSNAGYGAGAGQVAGGAIGVSGSSYESSSTQVQQYATDSQGLFNDPNPQIIRRAAIGGIQTYTQNIRVRFLQPPPIPPPGVSNLYDFSWSVP